MSCLCYYIEQIYFTLALQGTKTDAVRPCHVDRALRTQPVREPETDYARDCKISAPHFAICALQQGGRRSHPTRTAGLATDVAALIIFPR
jgi:hypothetical protein